MKAPKVFTRTIWILGLISLFSDIASEMLYPVMPIYLKTIGFTALWIGILEGIAEAAVGLSKGYFGKLSDEKGIRLPFVRLGYFLSGISKTMMALFISPVWILFARTSDRLGKGIRTGARDAMLSDECIPENKGKVFGFHRAMDTAGAAIGPVLALVYLYFYPGNYKPLFFIAFAPSMIGVLLTFVITEKNKWVEPKNHKENFFSYFSYWQTSSSEYRRLIIGFLIFAVFNSSDIFLLLMAKNIGISDQHIIIVYIFYNLVYALFALPLGRLADSIGMKKIFCLGLILFFTVYVGMGFIQGPAMLFVLFLIYGLFAAATEGVSKAWISKISPKQETATAIGFYSSVSSIATMVASTTAGWIWVSASPQLAFIVSAAGALIALIYFAIRTK